ncbi:DUF1631 family protein [Lysobacter humi (ex Lee et al. 2017)]
MSVPFPPSSRIPAAAFPAAALPRRVRETLESIHALAFELIVDPLDRLLPELEARLAHLQDRGAQHTVSVSYMAQAQILQRRQAAFIAAYMQAIDAELGGLRDRARSPPPPAEVPVAMPSFEELRIVEEDEEDEATEVRAIALRQEARAALPLQLLCQRFAVLAESPAFDVATVPLGPRRLCELMLEAATANGFSLSLRIAILREFDRRVLAEYPGITEAANDLLARQRIMPGLSYVPLRPRPRTVAPATDALAEQDRPLTGWTADASAEADHLTFQLLQELLASRRAIADRFRGPGEALAEKRAELGTAEVLEFLAQADRSLAGHDIEAIRQWLLLQGRRARGHAVALTPQDSDTFELLGLMYAHVLRDVRPEPAPLAMLDALKLPLLRTGLADAAFFVRSSHPARELLNAVAESAARWYAPEDIDPQLHAHLQRVVADVAGAADPMQAFRAAVQSLDTQMQAAMRRADIAERRNVEAARGKEKLAVARQRATAVIEAALATARVPVFHRGMLRHAWADVLTLGHLRHGEQGPDWQVLVEATADLVRAAAGGPAVPGLADNVEQWLVAVGYHADDAGRIARLLAGETNEDDDEDAASTRTELALKLKARARLGEDALPDTSHLPPMTDGERGQLERLQELPAGAWFELAGPAGPLRRRLSWTSPVTGHALFVNPRGQRVGESTLDELARQLASGDARIVTAIDGRLVDRAWRAALQGLGAHASRAPSAAGDDA